MDNWYTQNLVCPIEKTPLHLSDNYLISNSGRKYPVVDGIPVMLLDNVENTMDIMTASLRRANGDNEVIDNRAPELYLESLGISDAEKNIIVYLTEQSNVLVDPVVSLLVAATSGITYKHLVGNLTDYPIPQLKLPDGVGKLFLDLGCNWGRWCIAAARKGYTTVGIDPSLGAVMTARRVADKMGLSINYVVGDARYLPFKNSSFDMVFSYSVLQHMSKQNVETILSDIERVLCTDGMSLIQMPNYLGIRNLQNQLKRRFKEAKNFEVRYWSISDLKNTFSDTIGKTTIDVDCFFGLGLQYSDIDIMPHNIKLIIKLSETLSKVSIKIGLLKYFADSLYVKSYKGK